MKISYTHPITQKRTSITLNNRIIRLWAIVNHIHIPKDEDVSAVESDDNDLTDGFMQEPDTVALLKIWLSEHHQEFLKGHSKHPTFISYFESIVLLEVENRLLRPL
ncbi:hypothetical protein RUL18_004604 [Vibrio parahaemolyticus]|nr:hypothetical protein [Vibrio parahaemolyticus]HCH1168436.1 hypothetical protein [Vibrio parahaemolyticus]